MRVLPGKAVMEQVVAGTLHFYHRSKPWVEMRSERTRQEEEARFRLVQKRAADELNALYDQACEQVGEHTASIFAIHAMLVEDEELTASVLSLIWEKGCTAEYAIRFTGESYAAQFHAMEDDYMRGRAADIQDIARRMIRPLVGGWEELVPEGGGILVSDDFLPSEIISLEEKTRGLIARRGSANSHSAILARAYGIPIIVETELGPEWDGHLAVMDGRRGQVYLDPDQTVLERLSLCGSLH